MRIRITKPTAPRKGFYFFKGKFAWFYGVNLPFIRIAIHLPMPSYKWVGNDLYRYLGPFKRKILHFDL